MGKRITKKIKPDIEKTFWVLQSDSELAAGCGDFDMYSDPKSALTDATEVMGNYDSIYVVECKPIKKLVRKPGFEEVDLD